MAFQGRSQTALLTIPQPYDSSKAYALLVALHGNGGTAASLAPAFSSFRGSAVLVAVPQGEYPKPGGGYSWFFPTEDRALWVARDTLTVRRVVELIEDVRARYRIGAVFVLGFSQGASLAYMIGLRNPSLVSGVAAISGYLPEIDGDGAIVSTRDITEARGVKLLIARGDRDALVGGPVFTAQRDFFRARGYAVTAFEFGGAHELTRELLSRVLRWIRETSRS